MTDTIVTIKSIIKDTKDTLKTAEYGLQDLTGRVVERKLSGLRNLVVFGRAVTNVLQNLRYKVPNFEEWYIKYKNEMDADPLMQYFYKLRSEILKEGMLKTSTHTYINKLEIPADLSRFGTPPPKARGFFIGDNIGGSGWEIQLPDGSLQKYYVDLPSDIGSVSLHFPGAPKSHLGKEVNGLSIEILSTMYIAYLSKMVNDAENRFND